METEAKAQKGEMMSPCCMATLYWSQGSNTGLFLPFCQTTGILLELHSLGVKLAGAKWKSCWKLRDWRFSPISFPAVLAGSSGLRSCQEPQPKNVPACNIRNPTAAQVGRHWDGVGGGDLELPDIRIVSGALLTPSLPAYPLFLRSETQCLLVARCLFKKFTDQNNPQCKIIIRYNLLYG